MSQIIFQHPQNEFKTSVFQPSRKLIQENKKKKFDTNRFSFCFSWVKKGFISLISIFSEDSVLESKFVSFIMNKWDGELSFLPVLIPLYYSTPKTPSQLKI